MPDSPRQAARRLRHALIATALPILMLSGCGGISVPSIPAIPDISKTGSASFSIDGSTFLVAQSGSIQASFGQSNPLTYSGPMGCRGRYFSGSYTEDIDVYFRYSKKNAYLLIDNGGEPVYRFGPPVRTGNRLAFSNPTPRGRRITVVINCPRGA